jgi:NAD(P)H-dependent flavin oxidoreductase YrpB (nitropropane dioxygenase family)
MEGHMLASGDAGKSWRSTRVAKQLGIDYPIIQAPFGGLPSQRLTATVSNLGGLGSLGAVTLGSSAISEVIAEIRSLTSKPFAINLWVSTSDREASQVGLGVIEERIRALAAAFALGAEGVQIGTAFLPCAGSGASEAYRTALSLFAGTGTDLTDAFTGRLARGIRNRLMKEFRDVSSPPLPFPVQHALTQTVATPASAQGALELMTIWAGQNASLCHSTDATEFMTQLIAEAEKLSFLSIGKLFLLCERQEMRMKHDESAEFPRCSGGRGVRSCNVCSRGRGEARVVVVGEGSRGKLSYGFSSNEF